MDPTLAGFNEFIRNVMGITTAQLPVNSPVISWVFNYAVNIVNNALQAIPNSNRAFWNVYAIAVYNLAGDRLVNYAPDQTGMCFFQDLRTSLGLNSSVLGVINSTSDNGTSQSMSVPDWTNNLTIADLQTLKTPWGRNYLGIAQSYGTLWGLT